MSCKEVESTNEMNEMVVKSFRFDERRSNWVAMDMLHPEVTEVRSRVI